MTPRERQNCADIAMLYVKHQKGYDMFADPEIEVRTIRKSLHSITPEGELMSGEIQSGIAYLILRENPSWELLLLEDPSLIHERMIIGGYCVARRGYQPFQIAEYWVVDWDWDDCRDTHGESNYTPIISCKICRDELQAPTFERGLAARGPCNKFVDAHREMHRQEAVQFFFGEAT